VNAGLADPRPWLPAGYLTPALLVLFSFGMMILSLPADRAYSRREAAEYRRFQEESARIEQGGGRGGPTRTGAETPARGDTGRSRPSPP
jgi:hypothetical protein